MTGRFLRTKPHRPRTALAFGPLRAHSARKHDRPAPGAAQASPSAASIVTSRTSSAAYTSKRRHRCRNAVTSRQATPSIQHGSRNVKKNAGGFTLIELVAVMAILAILAVVAIPKFSDLRIEAANAAAAGVGGAIASGAAINYAKGTATPASGAAVGACTAAALAPMLIGATPSGNDITVSGRAYTITGDATISNGDTGTCSALDKNITGATAQEFHVIGCTAAGGCAS